MRLIRSALVAILVASVVGCVAAEPDPEPTPTMAVTADWLFHGGEVLTMDVELPRATALAVLDDEILAVGEYDDLVAHVGEATRVVDLQGSTLMPGFIDTHSHYFGHFDMDAAEIHERMLSVGVTTTGELGAGPEVLERLRSLEASGELRVRVSAYLVAIDNCGDEVGEWYLEHPPTHERGEMLRIAGVKVFTDGGSCGPPAASFEYTGGGQGDLFFTPEELLALLQRIDEQGYQLAVHALGDRAIDATLTALESIIGDSGNPLRHRIEHNALVAPHLNGRWDQAGVVATIFGAYATCVLTNDGNAFAYATPDEYVEWEWQWRRLLDENPNTVVAWHGDAGPFADPSPIRALFGFETRRDPDGSGGFCEPEAAHLAGAITVEEALPMMTTNAAYALFREEEIGSLTQGLLADLIILTDDPTAVDPNELLNTSVIFTMVGGRAEYCVNVFTELCTP